MATVGSLPPSLSRIQSPLSRSPMGSEGDPALQMSFPEINQLIDVEQEITQFVKDLDANEGREEFVFRTKLPQNPGAAEGGAHPKPLLMSASETSRDWGADVATPTSTTTGPFDQMSSLKMTYYAFKETTGQKTGIPVSLVLPLPQSPNLCLNQVHCML